ncbi:MAG TPA: TonB-dependent receptor [Hyphomonadaceae bacterium]|nr:TonB-dependent receptor [Hyphomonadaceae bacterium]
MSTRLQDLERQTGIELLYDGQLVSGIQSPGVRGTLTTEDALRQLLAETNLTVRRAESGAWIIERPETPTLAQQDAAVTQILVMGARTQNADIRRTETDVQPYVVATKKEILAAHRDDIDQYFRSRVTSNTSAIPPGLARDADTQSEFDIRGLGAQSTLVLVDGRRMPGFPLPAFGFGQADVNAIPLHAIERIEVLTGAAGGIYGFGALGGVINVVLDRDSTGADLHITEGISSRGDARRQMVEARYGYTSEDGSTTFTAFASHSESDPLLVGQRDYEVRDRRRTFELAPDFYLFALNPPGNSVGVFSQDGGNLVLKPGFGGAALGSSRTFLPAGFSGNTAALTSSLTQHAGELDFSLSQADANSDLGSRPQMDALFVNLRQRFDAGLEVYADAMVLRSHGESVRNQLLYGMGTLTAEAPANPFTETIQVIFPVDGIDSRGTKRLDTTRYTFGVLADLPFEWRGAAEASWGEFRYADTGSSIFPGSAAFPFLSGDPSDPDINPLGDWDTFQRALIVDAASITSRYEVHNLFSQHSLRLAGPVFDTAEGPATLTLLAERTSERMPLSVRASVFSFGGPPETNLSFGQPHSIETTSLYAELRGRVFGDNPPTPFLRGLEFQLAVRRDDREEDFFDNPAEADPGAHLHSHFIGTSYTAGIKLTPTPWLMLRGSYATGEQPPPFSALREEEVLIDNPIATDPKRGNTFLGSDGGYFNKRGGFAGLKAVRATTAFVGAMLMPFGEDGASLALDVSRIEKTRDFMLLSPSEVLDREDLWPERVVRLPLSDADRALEYTGGRIHTIDTRAINGGGQEVDALDIRAEWPLEFLGGRLRLYGDATYHMRNVVKALFRPDERLDGYRDGPLRWRANGGFDWSNAWLSVGANVQYLNSNLIYWEDLSQDATEFYVGLQGSRKIPSQTYLDLNATWWLPVPSSGPVRDLALNFGIVNVLDEAPPRENSFVFQRGPGYSRYGDPRQRRFEITLSSHF